MLPPLRIGHSVFGRYVAFRCLTRSWALLDARRSWRARLKDQTDLARQVLTTSTSVILRRILMMCVSPIRYRADIHSFILSTALTGRVGCVKRYILRQAVQLDQSR
jgi:hypothetical protein